jgi:hypothetical protein
MFKSSGTGILPVCIKIMATHGRDARATNHWRKNV